MDWNSESNPHPPSSLQSMLARLRGMVQALKTAEGDTEELLPNWDAAERLGQSGDASPSAAPAAERPEPEAPARETVSLAGASGSAAEVVSSAPQLCPYCQAARSGEEVYCAHCGWVFAPSTEPSRPPVDMARPRVQNRYELCEQIGARGQVARYNGLDHGADGGAVMRVIILRAAVPEAAEAIATSELPAAGSASDESPPALAEAEATPLQPVWPTIAWERALLETLEHPVLPRVLSYFVEDGFEYLVEELPVGRPLWDAWEDPAACALERFAWLKQIAGALYHLTQNNVLLEAVRPDIVVLTPEGQPRLTDVSDLLPLPLPANPPIRATYYTAPELVLASDRADGRAAVYSFGAMLYALHLGRELTDLDFELQGIPKSFLERFPDAHPLFGRLVSKTFCRDLNGRLPTEAGGRDDATGFTELIRILEDCRQTLDGVRLEIAAWTTTGMVRSNNEDAFALFHTAQARENQLGEAALVLLADGMGGYEAGEVAAALAIRALRDHLFKQQPFAAFAGADNVSSSQDMPETFDVEKYKQLLSAALREANREVYTAACAGLARDGMGCTAEVVYVAGRHVVVGHVGDSRTYHLHHGRLLQLTRDQTWVNRMVEMGALTAAEAETHPRRSELQQAIGGSSDVEPALYDAALKPGDWVVVCSDGLSNQTAADVLKEMLQSAPSAEYAARRLINAVNLAGATDNATVVVIRAT